MVQPILSVIRDIQVFPPVIVIVPNANSLPPTRGSKSGFLGHVRKSTVMIVAVQVAGWFLSAWKAFELGAVDQKNVRPAIVVVVENRDSRAGRLNDVLLGEEPAENILRR